MTEQEELELWTVIRKWVVVDHPCVTWWYTKYKIREATFEIGDHRFVVSRAVSPSGPFRVKVIRCDVTTIYLTELLVTPAELASLSTSLRERVDAQLRARVREALRGG